MATIEVRDTEAGKKSYRVKVRLKGYPVQSATFDRITDAKKWAQQTEAAIREGRHFKTREAKKHTLGELIDRYISTVLRKKTESGKFIQNQNQQLLWWKEKIGDYLLADITPALISEYRDTLLKADSAKDDDEGVSQSTANRYLAALSHCFTMACKEWGWLEANPVANVNRLREPRGRVRFLDDDEREKLLQACRESKNQYLYTVVVLALSTGARQGEIIGLRWRDVDFGRKAIILHQTKNGERRNLHLVGHALDILRDHAKVRRLDSDLLFPSRNPKKPAVLRAPWLAALKVAGIEDFRFHDLRHSAASYLAMNGASLAEIAEVLGHKTLQMVKRYAHLSESHTSNVVASMNAKIFG